MNHIHTNLYIRLTLYITPKCFRELKKNFYAISASRAPTAVIYEMCVHWLVTRQKIWLCTQNLL